MSELLEPLSPELALVCPELGRLARAALPERPWEVAFKPDPRALVAAADVPALRIAPLPATTPPAVAQRPVPVPQPSPEPVPSKARRARRRIPASSLVFLLAAAAVAVGLFGPRDAPTLEAPSSPSPRPAAPAKRKASLAPKAHIRPAARPRASRPAATLPRVVAPSRSTARPRSSGGSPAGTRVVRSGTYRFGAGRLVVDGRRRVVVKLDTSLACAGRLIVFDLPIDAAGRFATVRPGAAPDAVTVDIRGVFTHDAARLSLRATLAGCDSGTLAFTARLR